MLRLFSVLLLALVCSNVFAQAHGFLPTGEFPKTDFENASVDMNSIMSGGPPKDGIPAVDNPVFTDIAAATEWLGELEPVVSFTHDGEARAYPLQILIYHEIVNDTIAGKPVSVTFCPLCNASIVFDRTVEGEVLDFGTTGRLRNSDLIMYDRQSETWWQQFTGKGIIGKYNTVALKQLPSQIVSFKTFANNFTDGKVLTKNTGFERPYGRNPYRGYDNINSRPFLYSGKIDDRLPPMERVLSLADGNNKHTLVPLSQLENESVLNIGLSQSNVVVIATTSVQSALDQETISESRSIPSAAAFASSVDGKELTFKLQDGKLIDEQTGSEWNAFGQAIGGTLKDASLQQIDRGVHFAFAWLAFDPDADIYRTKQ